MATSSQGVQAALQIVLAVVIAALAYYLYLSVTEPYEAVERQKELTELTRERMNQVRTAMIRYEREHERFLTTLDSLVMYLKMDSLTQVKGDSLFGPRFWPDSLPISPRTGKRFELAVNDTSRVKTYLLRDPDSDDLIGTTTPDITRLNVASWE